MITGDWSNFLTQPLPPQATWCRERTITLEPDCFGTSEWRKRFSCRPHSGGAEESRFRLRLRLDHGALAALLMPTPTTDIVVPLRRILEQHNLAEEGPDGLYEICVID